MDGGAHCAALALRQSLPAGKARNVTCARGRHGPLSGGANPQPGSHHPKPGHQVLAERNRPPSYVSRRQSHRLGGSAGPHALPSRASHHREERDRYRRARPPAPLPCGLYWRWSLGCPGVRKVATGAIPSRSALFRRGDGDLAACPPNRECSECLLRKVRDQGCGAGRRRQRHGQ